MENLTTRKKCVLCEATFLEKIWEYTTYPFIHSETTEIEGNDKLGPMGFLYCINCECVQMEYLVDQTFLYSIAHNITTHSNLWINHHILFAKFILSNEHGSGVYKYFMEIGGYSGSLVKEIKKYQSEFLLIEPLYTILDICDRDPNIKDVKFISGNRENYNFGDQDTLLSSHTFEHLYNPSNFIKNAYKNNVQVIYISIPNLEFCLNQNILSFIHREHTFFYTTQTIKNFFRKNGYDCKAYVEYLNHSLFFKFQKIKMHNIHISPSSTPDKLIRKKFMEYFKNKEKYFKEVSTFLKQKKIYVSPGGYIGQAFYFMIEEDIRPNILGFIDNDINKAGKRTYGTSIYVNHPSQITDQIDVFVCFGVYSDEITKQLQKYKNINIVNHTKD